MESSALLANIALIVTKDLLNDEKKAEPVEPFYQFMFDDNDASDEAEFFYKLMCQQQRKKRKLFQKQYSNNIKCHPLDFVNRFDSQSFESYLHLSKSAFLRLYGSLSFLLSKRHLPNSMSPETIFSLALWKMCRDEHFEEIARRFDMPFFDCQISIRQFWNIVSCNENKFIVWPTKNDLAECQQKAKSKEILRPFGIVALKKLDIFLESSDQEVQVIWQVVSNTENKILDCYVELLQDYDFDKSPIGKVLNKQASQSQAYLIGDENFPLKTYLITPFLSPTTEKELEFNNTIYSSLGIAQNVYDTMAKRFNTLYALESKDLFEVRRILSTICCLHNLCEDMNDIERKQENVRSVNWTKPVCIGNNEHQPSQEARRRRSDLLDKIYANKSCLN